MRTKAALCSVAFVLALAVSAASQQRVCVRGEVVRGPAFSICIVRFTHSFLCGGLLLNPDPTVDLTPFEGQVAEVCGLVRMVPPTCMLMDVTSVRAAPEHMVIAGAGSNRTVPRGGRLSFSFTGAPGNVFVNLISAGNDFTDLGPPGVLQVESPFFVFNSGILDGSGSASLPVQVPNDASLQGAALFFQPVFVDLAARAGTMGNLDCLQIL